MTIFFSILVLASSLALIISVVLQESSEQGLGTLAGGSGALFGKTRGTSREDMLRRITVISAVIFMISTLVLAAK